MAIRRVLSQRRSNRPRQRGLFITLVALLYILFAVGVVLGKNWEWVGGTAAMAHLILVVGAVFQGASGLEAIAWSVIPIILLFYIVSRKEPDAIKGT